MPVQSRSQLRWLFAAEEAGRLPKGTAQRWLDHTSGKISDLPEKKEESQTKSALFLLGLPKMASDLTAPDLLAPKPYRERAEMYALKDGKLLGRLHPETNSFGVWGGGIDPGETPEQAAAREFLEETGFEVNNPRMIPVDPLTHEWSGPALTEEQKERQKQYRGSRTYYVLGDLGERSTHVKPSQLNYQDMRLWPVQEAIEKSVRESTDPNVQGLMEVGRYRKKVLEWLANQQTPIKQASLPEAPAASPITPIKPVAFATQKAPPTLLPAQQTNVVNTLNQLNQLPGPPLPTKPGTAQPKPQPTTHPALPAVMQQAMRNHQLQVQP